MVVSGAYFALAVLPVTVELRVASKAGVGHCRSGPPPSLENPRHEVRYWRKRPIR